MLVYSQGAFAADAADDNSVSRAVGCSLRFFVTPHIVREYAEYVC